MTTPTTIGGSTSGLVAGFTKLVATQQAAVWSYSISGGTMTSTQTDLQSATNNQLAAVCPDVTCSSRHCDQ